MFAFIALFCWGLGDFLIQKSSREFGKWVSLFFITFFAVIILTPFVYRDIIGLFSDNQALLLLSLASIVLLFAALFDFQALKEGKICVIEPIMALEIVVTAVLSAVLIKEFLTWQQMIFVALLIVGIFLVSTKSFHHFKNIKAEKGIVCGLLGTLGMGVTNFLFGIGSRQVGPLMINWFTCLVLALVTFVYLVLKARKGEILKDWHKDKALIVGVGLIDNGAWIAYSYSTLYIPITIATSISESYVALAALLGLVFNGEKLRRHQFIGLVLAIVSAIILAAITPD
jgi:drug/metabolite transporter (DMT)-like permease